MDGLEKLKETLVGMASVHFMKSGSQPELNEFRKWISNTLNVDWDEDFCESCYIRFLERTVPAVKTKRDLLENNLAN